MLGKLMKHELKATSRLLIPLYLVLLCLSVINHFTLNYGAEEGIFALITGLLFMIQSLFTMAIVTATVVLMIARFYKNFLSNEGYLMFTLPVSSHQLVLSKLIITLFWTLISAVGAVVSWFIVVASINDINLASFTIETIKTFFGQLNATFGLSWITIFIQLLILGILFLVGNILLIYTSIAIGQLFKKYKIVASFVTYIVITTALQFLAVFGIASLGYVFQDNSKLIDLAPSIALPIAITIALIGCAIFYVITNYIFNRKLNLE